MLNLDWRRTPQQEQALSVREGMKMITNPIMDMVNRKREEDARFNDAINNIVVNTPAKYGSFMSENVLQMRNALKEAGSKGWGGNRELRQARQNILATLASDQQRYNYLAEALPAAEEKIKRDKYIKQTEALAALREATNKNPREINISEIEEIVSGTKYKNWNAILRDGMEEVYGKQSNVAPPVSKTNKEGVVVTSSAKYGGEWDLLKNEDGSIRQNDNGMPELRSVFDDPKNGLSNVKDFLSRSPMGYDATFKYFSDLYDSTPIDGKISRSAGAGDTYNNAVLGFASNYLKKVVRPPDYDFNYRSVQDGEGMSWAEWKKREDYKNQNKTESRNDGRVDEIDLFSRQVASGNYTQVRNRITTNLSSENIIFSPTTSSGYYKNDETNDVIKKAQYDTLPQADKSKFKQWSGIAWTTPIERGKFPKTITIDGNLDSPDDARKVITEIYNMTTKSTDVTQTSGGGQKRYQTPNGQKTLSELEAVYTRDQIDQAIRVGAIKEIN